MDVRVPPGDVRVAVVADVVRVPPRLLVDGRVPAELLRGEPLGAGELVVGAVQRGVADLGRLQLLVQPEGDDAEEERDGLEAEVDEDAADDLHRAREAIEAADVGDVGVAHAGEGLLLDRV